MQGGVCLLWAAIAVLEVRHRLERRAHARLRRRVDTVLGEHHPDNEGV